MNQKFLIAWAVSATAVALLAIGYVLGKSARSVTSAPVPAHAVRADYGTRPTNTTDTSEGRLHMQPVDAYVVPEAFNEMPNEWRSRFDGEHFEGYAILFDPARREVIVEQCRHPGYYDEKRGVAVEDRWEFCKGVMWGSLKQIEESSAIAVDRTGQTIDIELSLNAETRPPQLLLSFGDHSMVLEPGSKNDLLQAMESSPKILGQRDQLGKSIAAQQQAQRRIAEESADGRAADIPTYSLPVGKDVADNKNPNKK